MKKYILIVMVALLSTSCAELLQIASALSSQQPGVPAITESDNAAGLKSALDVGLANAVKTLGVENGFLNDALLKIGLPQEASTIVQNIQMIPGGPELVERAILSLNRTAEDAVQEATPIFKNAIMNMSFTDATKILFGDENAATQYLRENTSAELVKAFAPKVRNSLEKPLVMNVSTNESWRTLTTNYNKAANSIAGLIAGLKPVEVDLEEYVTQQAVNALFVKVEDEEKKIRENPMARVNSLLQTVFGQLDLKK